MTKHTSSTLSMAAAPDAQVLRQITPQEVIALLRGVTNERELEQRFGAWNRASTDPAVPRFALQGALGKGSQGTVWAVADRDFLRQVAVKTMHERDRLPEDVSRFIHEAQITAQLEHPGVVPVHDLQVMQDGTVFYVMKRIEGKTLAELLPNPEDLEDDQADRRRLDLIEILLKVLDTIAFAHSRGVIHRDLKPKNIMVGPFGEVLVLDWGLAKIIGAADDTPRHGPAVFSLRSLGEDGGSANATGAGCAVGTPAFMSPEQATGKPADARSDVYGIGVILYHVLSGQSPYDVTSGARHVLEQAANGVWVPLEERQAAHRAPRRLIAIVHKAMATDPQRRYASAAELAKDLRQFLAGEAVAAYRESPLDKLVRLVARHQRVVTTGLGVAALAGGVWFVMAQRQAAHHRSQVNELRHQAQQADLLQNWDDARSFYDRLLDLEPGDRNAQNALQRIRVAQSRRTEEEVQRRKELEAHDLAERARRLAKADADEQLREAEKTYLQALGLTPGDPILREEYGTLTKRLAERDALVRASQREADRHAEAAKLRVAALEAERKGLFQEAIGHLESANSIHFQPEDSKRISDLVQRRDRERQLQADAARRLQADRILANLGDLVAANRGREARESLEQARGVDPAHPALPAWEPRVQSAEAIEHQRAAEKALAEAQQHLTEAQSARQQAEALETSRRQLADALVDAPTDDARRNLQRIERQYEAARLVRARALAAGLAGLHQARTEAPWHQPVKDALADFYVDRLREAESEGLPDEAAAALAQALVYDTGKRAALLRGEATVAVVAGGEGITLTRIECNDLRLLAPAGEPVALAPGTSTTIVAGRWLAVGEHGARLAVTINRGESRTITLPRKDLPKGLALVPGEGSVPTIGLMFHEVTCGEYLAFLNDPTVRQEIDEAKAAGRLVRLPRATYTSTESLWRPRGSVLRSSGGSVIETTDGRSIDLNAPVTGISAEDAAAYARWRSRRDGLRWRLPTIAEWRRAVQGGDRRSYPWGDAVDLSLCASASSCAALGKDVLPPVGSFPVDRTVQGVEDLAGSVSEFVDGAEEAVVSTGGVRLVPMMGGNRFEQQPERFTANHRRDTDPRFVHPGVGFRLALDP